MWRASCAVRPKLFVDMRNHIPDDLIERLYFYKQVDVIRVAPTDTSTNITAYFYVCQLPLESIIQLETLKAFGFPGKERKSYLKGIMLLRSAVDRTNNLCVTPQGYLHLVLDKESYEQFGVVGTKLKGKMEYFHVQVDLHRLVSSKGSLRSRLEWCLKKSSNPVDLAISCTIPLEQVPLQGLQSYRKISIEPTTLWMEEKRVPFIDEWLVRLSTYITQGEAALQELAATMPSDIEFIVQWIGALVTQCPGLMMDMQSELLCDYICPHIEEMYPLGFRTDAKDWTVETMQHQQWQGFIGCDMIKSICESLQREVQQNIVKWAVISCQSFQDAPVVYHNKIIRAAAPAMEHSCGWIGIVSSTAGSEGNVGWWMLQLDTQSFRKNTTRT
ncbi:hypothetical protein GAYE_SCF09G3176 [Galdieria yellowstonensis]|uniref:Uncharacterized protein n=1 Tax=Galdieria yellowstonensis TaxID=3028027 RepID=A0AAV9IDC9_9RHOD|nr:hypothetical protein GAYE_SCF09G3176 [Galdieria yellowstonensis]